MSPDYLNTSFGLLSIYRGKFRYSRILEQIGIEEGARILDVGTGYGSIFFAKFPQVPSQIVAVDHSKPMIQKARKSALSLEKRLANVETNVVQASANMLPFEDNSFDLVIDSKCLYLLEQGVYKEALNEYYRLITEKGKVILNSPRGQWIEEVISEIFPIYSMVQTRGYFPTQKIPIWVLEKVSP